MISMVGCLNRRQPISGADSDSHAACHFIYEGNMRRSHFRAHPLVISALIVCGHPGLRLGRAEDVLTQHFNNARTGATLDEKLLNTSTVTGAKFGRKWALYADGQVVAQPLYVSSLAIDTTANTATPLVKGTFNAVIIATMHNTVYVYDADKENRGPDGRTVPLWAKWLNAPRRGGKDIDMWSTNDPEWGILSTPVISPDKSTLYVVSWHDDGPAGLQYRLHALDLRSGADRQPPANLGPSSTSPSQPCKQQSPFNPCVHKQRSALLLSQGLVYIAFGGDGNRGALYVFDAQTLTERAFWTSTPTGGDGGIWQSGQGPAADAEGNVYLMTGNGSFDGNNNTKNFGNSFVKLKVEGQNVVVKDFFTPCNFQFLNQLDLDLGSGGPVLLPINPPRVIGGGKEGCFTFSHSPTWENMLPARMRPIARTLTLIQQVQAFEVHNMGGKPHYGNIHGSPVYWKGPDTERIYAWARTAR